MPLVQKFLKLEAASGILLVLSLLLAMILENSPLKSFYDMLLNVHVEVRVGPLQLAKPLLLWVNDALMAVFFFLIGLELKREILVGELSSYKKVALPFVAALAGIIVPAAIYSYINQNDSIAIKGWAIPTATDIAFALGILSLLGNRVPAALKLLLLAIAIFDDIGAISIIAIFYSGDLSLNMFFIAGVSFISLAILNKRDVTNATPYILIGIILWIAVLKSGVHATLAGILLAMFIPLHSIKSEKKEEKSLLIRLEQDLHSTVAFFVLPVFAFANAGVSLEGVKVSDLFEPLPLGIILGLVLGKQLGIFGSIWLAVKLGFAKLPEKINMIHIYGLSSLCGIGFTMSLFISSLAFEHDAITSDRLGILVGSIFSALLGYAILRIASKD